MFLILIILLSVTNILNSEPIIKGTDVGKIDKTGKIVNNGEFNYAVLLKMKTIISEKEVIWYCGGIILELNIILTAGHCLAVCNTAIEITAFGGILDTKLEKAQVIQASDYKVHEDFNTESIDNPGDPNYFHNDIAIIWLQSSFVPGKKLAKANIAKKKYKIFLKDGTVSGWGYNENCEISQMLQKATFTVISDKGCSNFYDNHNFNGKTFCALSTNKESIIAEGDSGGAFVFKGTVVGIISFTGKTAQKESGALELNSKIPVIFTDIFEYKTWIEQNKKLINRKEPLQHSGNCYNPTNFVKNCMKERKNQSALLSKEVKHEINPKKCKTKNCVIS